jgi:hypothetical protein
MDACDIAGDGSADSVSEKDHRLPKLGEYCRLRSRVSKESRRDGEGDNGS